MFCPGMFQRTGSRGRKGDSGKGIDRFRERLRTYGATVEERGHRDGLGKGGRYCAVTFEKWKQGCR